MSWHKDGPEWYNMMPRHLYLFLKQNTVTFIEFKKLIGSGDVTIGRATVGEQYFGGKLTSFDLYEKKRGGYHFGGQDVSVVYPKLDAIIAKIKAGTLSKNDVTKEMIQKEMYVKFSGGDASLYETEFQHYPSLLPYLRFVVNMCNGEIEQMDELSGIKISDNIQSDVPPLEYWKEGLAAELDADIAHFRAIQKETKKSDILASYESEDLKKVCF